MVKQHLAALRTLFDWLITGHAIDMNPARTMRSPKGMRSLAGAKRSALE